MLIRLPQRPLTDRDVIDWRMLADGPLVDFSFGLGLRRVTDRRFVNDDGPIFYTDGSPRLEMRTATSSARPDSPTSSDANHSLTSPPETVRCLIHAVIDYQQGILHDDATILLAFWTRPPGPTLELIGSAYKQPDLLLM